jgi:hypothetical protein
VNEHSTPERGETITQDQVRALLATAMAIDNRRPGEAAVIAWHDLGNEARWTFPEALAAIKSHYRESTEFLMPGHITKLIRAGRRADAEKFDRKALPPASPASQEVREEAMTKIRAVIGDFGKLPADVNRPTPGSPEAMRRLDDARTRALTALDDMVQATAPAEPS